VLPSYKGIDQRLPVTHTSCINSILFLTCILRSTASKSVTVLLRTWPLLGYLGIYKNFTIIKCPWSGRMLLGSLRSMPENRSLAFPLAGQHAEVYISKKGDQTEIEMRCYSKSFREATKSRTFPPLQKLHRHLSSGKIYPCDSGFPRALSSTHRPFPGEPGGAFLSHLS